MSCPECGGQYVLDNEICSAICTRCGHLDDPGQTLLADHIEATHHHHTHFTHTDALSHRPIRNRKGWDLAGQSKEARHKKNMAAMAGFITSVLSRLNNPGLSPRAQAIFAQAMAAGGHRWGRRAKLTAGASIAVALRESNKSDSLRDIAFLLDDSPLSLSRAFQSLVSLLDFSLSSTDPSVHLPTLQSHLLAILRPDAGSSSSVLPQDLFVTLTPLSLPAAVRTATSLAGIISTHVPTLDITRLPTPPTACALFILALEAETRTPLPHVSELARALAGRFGLAGGVVSSRYKSLYDTIEEWIREVPWLDQFTLKKNARGRPARPKLPKRAVVAKGIKDVIQFREEIWKKRMDAQHRISLVIESDPGENPSTEDDGPSDSGCAVEGSSSKVPGTKLSECTQAPSAKRLKVAHGITHEAYQLLLNPLSSRISSSSYRHPCDNTESGGYDVDVSIATDLLTYPPGTEEEQEFLTKRERNPPTRLQLLAISRGGSAPEDIADDELFEQDELEGFLRTEAEREALIPLFELNWGGEKGSAQDSVPDQTPVAQQKNQPIRAEHKRGAKRVNMEVLSRILEGSTELSSLPDSELNDDRAFDNYDTDDDYYSKDAEYANPNNFFGEDASLTRVGQESGCAAPATRRPIEKVPEAETIGDWRPLSPEGGGFRRFGDSIEDNDRYEEEY
ncbi:hypothetical protein ID866_4712 [Astraeus odoratus]|nr:hypothetical protein ID866_4712 [Astraeus odoratus]